MGLSAKSYREAGALATQIMMLPLVSLIVMISDPPTSLKLLLTPVVGSSLMTRDVLRGALAYEFVAAFGWSPFFAVCWSAPAARMFANESIVSTSWEPLSLSGLGKLAQFVASAHGPSERGFQRSMSRWPWRWYRPSASFTWRQC